ncbi:cystathionine beta-lyase [Desulfuromusa kysingii]|uniref:Cystathionine beta-lyase n=1 Tax=Desulfuromusa kysingii TaxID=37625 RepID=A0A1H3X8B4_9BACT|nr:cystathionine beta-lyase [Desulfuromusa kysingii]SDZ95480.1 cystathionine beta-lyase [Desulfuromusa kysingii]
MERTTRLVNFDAFHQGQDMDLPRTINPPIFRGSTVLFDNFAELSLANSGKYQGITYGTDRMPTQRAFEEAVRELEGGALTRAFQSGISAIINTFLAFTKSGDHILVCDNAYAPTVHYCTQILTKFNIETTFIPPAAGEEIQSYLKDNTKLIFLESPGSNTFELQDIPAITTLAKKRGIITVLDNTWATPLYLDPFALGINISIQSATKYLTGHSDILMGTVTTDHPHAATLQEYYRITETYTAEEDCYTALRGLRTLALRLRQHEQSALAIAQWLESLPQIGNVIHPALPSHPQHQIWQRDFSGSSGLFAFTFKEEYPAEKLAAFIDSLQLFGIGYSWGGFRSLITAAKYNRTQTSRYAGKMVIRLNIGLEDPGDIIKDLTAGFEAMT